MQQVLTRNAASIASARYAPLGPTVKPGDPITGALTWRNNGIAQGTNLILAYAFGVYDTQTGTFYYSSYQHQGKTYVHGSRSRLNAPAIGTTLTESITSFAFQVSQQVALDAVCIVGDGSKSFGVHGENYRILGLLWSDLQELPLYDAKLFPNVLTISP